jgi:hypothetical protein
MNADPHAPARRMNNPIVRYRVTRVLIEATV